MAKVKLTLTPAPTFKAIVKIPVPGSRLVDVEFTFKGRTRTEYEQLWEDVLAKRWPDDADVVLEIASGWDLDEPFDREHIQKMDENYLGSTKAIWDVYKAEISGARLGN